MGGIVRGQWGSFGGTVGQLWEDKGKWGTLGELWGNNWGTVGKLWGNYGGTVGKLWGNYWGTVVNDVANYGRFEPTPIPVVPDRRHDIMTTTAGAKGRWGVGRGKGQRGVVWGDDAFIKYDSQCRLITAHELLCFRIQPTNRFV